MWLQILLEEVEFVDIKVSTLFSDFSMKSPWAGRQLASFGK